MHELSLSESIVELVCRLSAREGLSTVTRVELEVGEAAGVDREALCFCFDVVTRATPAEGAELCIEHRPARGECTHCGELFPMPGGLAPCPACGAWGARLVSGQELRVRAFDGV